MIFLYVSLNLDRVIDPDEPLFTLEQTIRVNITNVNEDIDYITLEMVNENNEYYAGEYIGSDYYGKKGIREDAPIGTVVGKLKAIDYDSIDTHTFELINKNNWYPDNDLFQLSGDLLITKEIINFEDHINTSGRAILSVFVKATDTGGKTYEKLEFVYVINVNEPVTNILFDGIAIANGSVNVDEDVVIGTTVGTFTTTDPDDADNHDYEFSISDETIPFEIDNIGNLKTTGSLDYETKTSYTFDVTVIDKVQNYSAGEEYTLTKGPFTININNKPDAPHDILLNNTSVSENAANGDTVGTFTTADQDTDASRHTYQLLTGNVPFYIENNSNVLKTSGELDYESYVSYDITVRSTDDDGLFIDKTFTINVININEVSTDITLDRTDVDESQPSGTVVGTFSTSDPDNGNTFTYTLTTNDVPFEIIGNDLRTTRELNYEGEDQTYVINVTSYDGANTISRDFTITVNDINEAPTDIVLTKTHDAVNENVQTEYEVGTFSTIDEDANSSFTYTLNTNNVPFKIVDNKLITTDQLDYAQSPYNITVTSEDNTGLSTQKSFDITLHEINLTLDKNSVNENVDIETKVGTFATTDPIGDKTFTYTLSTSGVPFKIDGNELKTDGSLDYETQPNSYTIEVVSNDNAGSYPITETFTITVNDVNEAPTDITLDKTDVNESQPSETVVGTFETIDPDNDNTHIYTLTTNDVPFEIIGNVLRTTRELNYEGGDQTYVINVTSNDGENTISREFTITVNNINEAPTSIQLNKNSVNENVDTGHIIGTFTTSDPDASDTTFTYTIKNSVSTPFEIDNNGNLKTTNTLNHEANPSYTLTVLSEDIGGLSVEEDFTITVNEINLTLDYNSVNEDVNDGTVVGTFTTTDPFNDKTFTYTLNTEGVPFKIDGDKLKTVGSLDFDANESYGITVTSDDGEYTVQEDFTITIVNVNKPPTDITLDGTDVNENQPSETVVGTFETIDPDNDNTHIYTLTTNDVPFEIIGNVLRTTRELNYEGGDQTYVINVTSNDGENTISREFTITVNNINEAPTSIQLNKNSVNENVDTGHVIGTFTTSDPDASDTTFTYTIINSVSTPFEIDINGNLKTTNTLNHEANPSYTLTVLSEDSGGLSVEEDFTITVNEINLTLDYNSVNEDVGDGTVVGTFTTTDPFNDKTFTYTLNTEGVPFKIDGDKLKTVGSLDFDANESYGITVTSDDGEYTVQEDFTITIVNVNKPPTDITLDGTDVNESQISGTVVGTFETIDPDNDNTHIYTLTTNDVPFEIIGNVLRTTRELNYEGGDQSYDINVTSYDGANTISREFTITVNNINEAPTDIVLTKTHDAVNENVQIGYVVGTFSTSDEDENSTFTYTLNTNNVPFYISGNELKTDDQLDFAQSPYSIRVISEDNTGSTVEKSFDITLREINLTLDIKSVNENVDIETKVGTFATTDPIGDKTFTYTLSTSGVPFKIDGNELKTDGSLDYETQPNSYTIEVVSNDDAGSYPITEEFTITVNNINEAPTDITLDKTDVDENVDSGTVVGTFEPVDPDNDNTFTYTLNNVNNVPFKIIGSQLITDGIIDYETQQEYSFDVTINDGLNNFTREFTINVININEPPTNLTLSKNNVDENMNIGTEVGTFTTTDPDDSTFTYSLDTNDVPFSIDINTGILTTTEELDHETKSSYTFDVTSLDNANNSITREFTIYVNDINETPTSITLNNNSVNENAKVGHVIGTFTTSDVDDGDTASYEIYTNTDSPPFVIDNNGNLKTNAILDYQTGLLHMIS